MPIANRDESESYNPQAANQRTQQAYNNLVNNTRGATPQHGNSPAKTRQLGYLGQLFARMANYSEDVFANGRFAEANQAIQDKKEAGEDVTIADQLRRASGIPDLILRGVAASGPLSLATGAEGVTGINYLEANDEGTHTYEGTLAPGRRAADIGYFLTEPLSTYLGAGAKAAKVASNVTDEASRLGRVFAKWGSHAGGMAKSAATEGIEEGAQSIAEQYRGSGTNEDGQWGWGNVSMQQAGTEALWGAVAGGTLHGALHAADLLTSKTNNANDPQQATAERDANTTQPKAGQSAKSNQTAANVAASAVNTYADVLSPHAKFLTEFANENGTKQKSGTSAKFSSSLYITDPRDPMSNTPIGSTEMAMSADAFASLLNLETNNELKNVFYSLDTDGSFAGALEAFRIDRSESNAENLAEAVNNIVTSNPDISFDFVFKKDPGAEAPGNVRVTFIGIPTYNYFARTVWMNPVVSKYLNVDGDGDLAGFISCLKLQQDKGTGTTRVVQDDRFADVSDMWRQLNNWGRETNNSDLKKYFFDISPEDPTWASMDDKIDRINELLEFVNDYLGEQLQDGTRRIDNLDTRADGSFNGILSAYLDLLCEKCNISDADKMANIRKLMPHGRTYQARPSSPNKMAKLTYEMLLKTLYKASGADPAAFDSLLKKIFTSYVNERLQYTTPSSSQIASTVQNTAGTYTSDFNSEEVRSAVTGRQSPEELRSSALLESMLETLIDGSALSPSFLNGDAFLRFHVANAFSAAKTFIGKLDQAGVKKFLSSFYRILDPGEHPSSAVARLYKADLYATMWTVVEREQDPTKRRRYGEAMLALANNTVGGNTADWELVCELAVKAETEIRDKYTGLKQQTNLGEITDASIQIPPSFGGDIKDQISAMVSIFPGLLMGNISMNGNELQMNEVSKKMPISRVYAICGSFEVDSSISESLMGSNDPTTSAFIRNIFETKKDQYMRFERSAVQKDECLDILAEGLNYIFKEINKDLYVPGKKIEIPAGYVPVLVSYFNQLYGFFNITSTEDLNAVDGKMGFLHDIFEDPVASSILVTSSGKLNEKLSAKDLANIMTMKGVECTFAPVYSLIRAYSSKESQLSLDSLRKAVQRELNIIMEINPLYELLGRFVSMKVAESDDINTWLSPIQMIVPRSSLLDSDVVSARDTSYDEKKAMLPNHINGAYSDKNDIPLLAWAIESQYEVGDSFAPGARYNEVKKVIKNIDDLVPIKRAHEEIEHLDALLKSPQYSVLSQDDHSLFKNAGLYALDTEYDLNDVHIIGTLIESVTLTGPKKEKGTTDASNTAAYQSYNLTDHGELLTIMDKLARGSLTWDWAELVANPIAMKEVLFNTDEFTTKTYRITFARDGKNGDIVLPMTAQQIWSMLCGEDVGATGPNNSQFMSAMRNWPQLALVCGKVSIAMTGSAGAVSYRIGYDQDNTFTSFIRKRQKDIDSIKTNTIAQDDIPDNLKIEIAKRELWFSITSDPGLLSVILSSFVKIKDDSGHLITDPQQLLENLNEAKPAILQMFAETLHAINSSNEKLDNYIQEGRDQLVFRMLETAIHSAGARAVSDDDLLNQALGVSGQIREGLTEAQNTFIKNLAMKFFSADQKGQFRSFFGSISTNDQRRAIIYSKFEDGARAAMERLTKINADTTLLNLIQSSLAMLHPDTGVLNLNINELMFLGYLSAIADSNRSYLTNKFRSTASQQTVDWRRSIVNDFLREFDKIETEYKQAFSDSFEAANGRRPTDSEIEAEWQDARSAYEAMLSEEILFAYPDSSTFSYMLQKKGDPRYSNGFSFAILDINDLIRKSGTEQQIEIDDFIKKNDLSFIPPKSWDDKYFGDPDHIDDLAEYVLLANKALLSKFSGSISAGNGEFSKNALNVWLQTNQALINGFRSSDNAMSAWARKYDTVLRDDSSFNKYFEVDPSHVATVFEYVANGDVINDAVFSGVYSSMSSSNVEAMVREECSMLRAVSAAGFIRQPDNRTRQVSRNLRSYDDALQELSPFSGHIGQEHRLCQVVIDDVPQDGLVQYTISLLSDLNLKYPNQKIEFLLWDNGPWSLDVADAAFQISDSPIIAEPGKPLGNLVYSIKRIIKTLCYVSAEPLNLQFKKNPDLRKTLLDDVRGKINDRSISKPDGAPDDWFPAAINATIDPALKANADLYCGIDEQQMPQMYALYLYVVHARSHYTDEARGIILGTPASQEAFKDKLEDSDYQTLCNFLTPTIDIVFGDKTTRVVPVSALLTGDAALEAEIAQKGIERVNIPMQGIDEVVQRAGRSASSSVRRDISRADFADEYSKAYTNAYRNASYNLMNADAISYGSEDADYIRELMNLTAWNPVGGRSLYKYSFSPTAAQQVMRDTSNKERYTNNTDAIQELYRNRDSLQATNRISVFFSDERYSGLLPKELLVVHAVYDNTDRSSDTAYNPGVDPASLSKDNRPSGIGTATYICLGPRPSQNAIKDIQEAIKEAKDNGRDIILHEATDTVFNKTIGVKLRSEGWVAVGNCNIDGRSSIVFTNKSYYANTGQTSQYIYEQPVTYSSEFPAQITLLDDGVGDGSAHFRKGSNRGKPNIESKEHVVDIFSDKKLLEVFGLNSGTLGYTQIDSYDINLLPDDAPHTEKVLEKWFKDNNIIIPTQIGADKDVDLETLYQQIKYTAESCNRSQTIERTRDLTPYALITMVKVSDTSGNSVYYPIFLPRGWNAPCDLVDNTIIYNDSSVNGISFRYRPTDAAIAADPDAFKSHDPSIRSKAGMTAADDKYFPYIGEISSDGSTRFTEIDDINSAVGKNVEQGEISYLRAAGLLYFCYDPDHHFKRMNIFIDENGRNKTALGDNVVAALIDGTYTSNREALNYWKQIRDRQISVFNKEKLKPLIGNASEAGLDELVEELNQSIADIVDIALRANVSPMKYLSTNFGSFTKDQNGNYIFSINESPHVNILTPELFTSLSPNIVTALCAVMDTTPFDVSSLSGTNYRLCPLSQKFRENGDDNRYLVQFRTNVGRDAVVGHVRSYMSTDAPLSWKPFVVKWRNTQGDENSLGQAPSGQAAISMKQSQNHLLISQATQRTASEIEAYTSLHAGDLKQAEAAYRKKASSNAFKVLKDGDSFITIDNGNFVDQFGNQTVTWEQTLRAIRAEQNGSSAFDLSKSAKRYIQLNSWDTSVSGENKYRIRAIDAFNSSNSQIMSLFNEFKARLLSMGLTVDDSDDATLFQYYMLFINLATEYTYDSAHDTADDNLNHYITIDEMRRATDKILTTMQESGCFYPLPSPMESTGIMTNEDKHSFGIFTQEQCLAISRLFGLNPEQEKAFVDRAIENLALLQKNRPSQIDVSDKGRRTITRDVCNYAGLTYTMYAPTPAFGAADSVNRISDYFKIIHPSPWYDIDEIEEVNNACMGVFTNDMLSGITDDDIDAIKKDVEQNRQRGLTLKHTMDEMQKKRNNITGDPHNTSDAKRSFWSKLFGGIAAVSLVNRMLLPGTFIGATLDPIVYGNQINALLRLGIRGVGAYAIPKSLRSGCATASEVKSIVSGNDSLCRLIENLNDIFLAGGADKILTELQQGRSLNDILNELENQGTGIEKFQRKIFKLAAGNRLGRETQAANFILLLQHILATTEDGRYDYMFTTTTDDANGNQMSMWKQMVSSEDLASEILGMFSANSQYNAFAIEAYNASAEATAMQTTATSILMGAAADKSPAFEWINKTTIAPFLQYQVAIQLRMFNCVLPMSTICFLVTKWDPDIHFLGKIQDRDGKTRWPKMSDFDIATRTARAHSLKQAILLDASRMGTSAMVAILLSCCALEPPEDDDKRNNIDEWLVFGFRVKEEWWLSDIIGPVIAIAAAIESMAEGKPNLDVLFNAFSTWTYNNPLTDIDDLIDICQDPLGYANDEYLEELDLYGASEYEGDPTQQEMLAATIGASTLNWATNLFTPAFIKDWYRNSQKLEKSYKKVYQTDAAGNIMLDSNGNPKLTYASYQEQKIRKVTRSNWLAAQFMNLITGDTNQVGYSASQMPPTIYYDPKQVESLKTLSLYDDEGNQKSDAECQHIALYVISTLLSNSDMGALYDSGFCIPYETLDYVGDVVWDIAFNGSETIQGELLRYGITNQTDNAEISQLYDSFEKMQKNNYNFWKNFYYDKLNSDEMKRGVARYNRYNTYYEKDANGEWYATGYRRNTPGIIPLPFMYAPGTRTNPGETMGYENDWATASVVTGESTGMRALIPAENENFQTKKFESRAADGNGGSYSNSYGDYMNYYNNGGGRSYGGGGGSRGYTSAPTVSAPRARTTGTMNGTFRPTNPSLDYLRPSLQTKGSREAYRREDF